MHRPTGPVRLAIIAGILLSGAGCSGNDQAAGPTRPTPPAPTPSASAIPATTPSPTSSRAPSPSSTAPKPPADGTDYRACRDGFCQVLVRGKAVLRIGATSFAVSVAGDGVTVTFNGADLAGEFHMGEGEGGGYTPGGGKPVNFVASQLTGRTAVLTVSTG